MRQNNSKHYKVRYSTLLVLLGIIQIICLMQIPYAYGKDYGIQGNVYLIKEEPFLKMIQNKLAKVDIAQEQQKMQQIARDRAENPMAANSIKRAEKIRESYFDPSYVVEEDIILPCGKILHKKGTIINPLTHMDLERRIYFIDGRDQEQVEWLKAELAKTQYNDREDRIEDRVILIGGSVFKVRETLEDMDNDVSQYVYFDQSGVLCKKWGIEFVPAIVVQEGLQLKISEIKVIR